MSGAAQFLAVLVAIAQNIEDNEREDLTDLDEFADELGIDLEDDDDDPFL